MKQAHARTLVRPPRAESYTHPFRADGLDARAGDLEHESRAILNRATILVRPGVAVRLHKLVQEIPVRGVDLHAVEPGAQHGILGRGRVPLRILTDLLHRQRARHWRRGCERVAIVGCRRERDRARPDDRVPAFLLEDVRIRRAPMREELEVDERPILAHRVYDLQPKKKRWVRGGGGREGRGKETRNGNATNWLPRCDLLVVPDAGNSCISARSRRDRRCLRDGQRSRDARALFVVFHRERARDVLRVGTEACHWGQHDAVL
jgi:hypothetical protein